MGGFLSRLKPSYVKLRASLPFASAERGTHPVHVSGWELIPGEPPFLKGGALLNIASGMHKVF